MRKPASSARSATLATIGSPIRCVGFRKPKERKTCTLLWIDDFAPGLAMYQIMFEQLGFRVLTACSGSEGVKLALSNYVDAVITDYEMPEMNGEAVAAAIKTLRPGVPVLMFSGSTLISSRCRRFVDAFCDKAGSRDELLAALHRLLHHKRTPMLQPRVAAPASDHRHRTVA